MGGSYNKNVIVNRLIKQERRINMRKIVVTGYGVKVPGSKNIEEFLDNIRSGVCGLETIGELAPNKTTTIVGRIKEGLEEYLHDKRYNRYPRIALLGLAAAKEALEKAKISDIRDKKVGLFFGTAIGAGPEVDFQESVIYSNQQNLRKVPVHFLHLSNYHSITASIGYFLDIKGLSRTVTTGCTSSLEAMQDAILYLRSGIIDVAIVGGIESPVDRAVIYAFAKTRALPLGQELDEGAIPFQTSSKGFAISEGSGVIILEREEDAVRRGANILGEIEEVVSNNDGTNIFCAEETGKQMIAALREVVRGRKPTYVHSQALGIQLNDTVEKNCSEDVFQHQVPFTSIKSMIGHPLGASGVIQVISALLSINYHFIPPTIRTNQLGYEQMNIVRETIFTPVWEVAVTNHGLGGNNSCAYIKKYEH